MSDARTTQPLEALETEAQQGTGHGRHRGPVSSHEDGAVPNGRHRKPAEEAEAAA